MELSTLAFSGYTIDEIRAQPLGEAVPSRSSTCSESMVATSPATGSRPGLRGSTNQRIQLLTSRYTLADVEATPVADIAIGKTGEVVLTGVNPLKLKR